MSFTLSDNELNSTLFPNLYNQSINVINNKNVFSGLISYKKVILIKIKENICKGIENRDIVLNSMYYMDDTQFYPIEFYAKIIVYLFDKLPVIEEQPINEVVMNKEKGKLERPLNGNLEVKPSKILNNNEIKLIKETFELLKPNIKDKKIMKSVIKILEKTEQSKQFITHLYKDYKPNKGFFSKFNPFGSKKGGSINKLKSKRKNKGIRKVKNTKRKLHLKTKQKGGNKINQKKKSKKN